MPQRKTPLVNQEIYHIYNRGVARQTIFHTRREYNIFRNSLEYYRFDNPPLRLSHFLRLKAEDKNELIEKLYEKNNCLVDIYAFSLMPNHYHLLIKQNKDNGITNFIRLVQNSYARYLNIKTKRFGSLFQSPFKAVRIESDEQFIHVARYIHLNPLTSYILKDFDELESYEWSSYIDYISKPKRRFIDTEPLIKMFKNKEKLKQFTKDNLDYQRKLDKIKHLLME